MLLLVNIIKQTFSDISLNIVDTDDTEDSSLSFNLKVVSLNFIPSYKVISDLPLKITLMLWHVSKVQVVAREDLFLDF